MNVSHAVRSPFAPMKEVRVVKEAQAWHSGAYPSVL